MFDMIGRKTWSVEKENPTPPHEDYFTEAGNTVANVVFIL